MLKFGEHLFDRVQVWAVGWQEHQPGPYGADGGSDSLAFMAAEIVEHDNIARLQGRHELLVYIGQEALRVDRTVEHAWCVDPVTAQRREERQRFPVSMRHLCIEPLPPRSPASQRRHVGLGPGLIDENQAPRIDAGLMLLPERSLAGDIRPGLLAGQDAFF